MFWWRGSEGLVGTEGLLVTCHLQGKNGISSLEKNVSPEKFRVASMVVRMAP
jgi:hypothetical protein